MDRTRWQLFNLRRLRSSFASCLASPDIRERSRALAMTPRFSRLAKTNASLFALVILSGCASLRSTSRNRINQQIAQADAAYRTLDADHVTAYNNAVAAIAREIDGETPDQVRSQLDSVHVKLDEPKIQLPLARYHLASQSRRLTNHAEAGIPMLLDYDTSHAPLYPRDGLLCSATAVYRRMNGEPHLSLMTAKTTIELNGSTFALNRDDAAPIAAMSSRGRHVARSGFRNMLRPGSMRERSGIFLTEPYDPNKAIVLMVPGLQSTPFAFADLMKAMRRDPEVSAHFQVWTFLYGTGTPVLFNALRVAAGTGKDDSRSRSARSRFRHETHRCSRPQHGRAQRAHIGQLKRRKVVELVVRRAAAAIAR